MPKPNKNKIIFIAYRIKGFEILLKFAWHGKKQWFVQFLTPEFNIIQG